MIPCYLMIDIIPLEICLKIGNFLSYKEFEKVNTVMQLNLSKKEMFTESQLFHSPVGKLHKTLNKFGMTKLEFFNTLQKSAWNNDNIYDLLLAIDNNKINSQTKYDYGLVYDMTNINNLTVKSTIAISQILLLNIEPEVNKEFIINNPYHYLCLQITNTLVFYFQNIVMKTFVINKNVEKNSIKFVLMMLEHEWYRSNINIYNLYVLYLSNIDVILFNDIASKEMIFDINDQFDNDGKILETCYINCDKNDVYKSRIYTMFQGGKYNENLDKILRIT